MPREWRERMRRPPTTRAGPPFSAVGNDPRAMSVSKAPVYVSFNEFAHYPSAPARISRRGPGQSASGRRRRQRSAHTAFPGQGNVGEMKKKTYQACTKSEERGFAAATAAATTRKT
ncbi:hypothetical protein HPB48_004390 [Haemaphysalis longicornis]|uniref:Uncharacterized protein n=1 Tax=Haemaphysalis longicornis TaxID=44386 RepID=A0A9J6G1F8_HAELO|nr:hypothetical protein HPB48_004390 [Haemaphysalis longicornis]